MLHLNLLLVIVPCLIAVNKCKLAVEPRRKKAPTSLRFSLSVPPLNPQMTAQSFAAFN